MGDLTDILNFRRLDERITTSGQPTEAQLACLQVSGVACIINLGPHDSKDALDDEPGTVHGLGMDYVYIPVDFTRPADADFDLFCAALEGDPGAKVHIHCFYNARVTAFLHRYALSGRGPSPDLTLQLMDSIWRPGRDWAGFLRSVEAAGKPNRYAGHDY
jgi:protein tyrosine phosphatase (PTP) superfamily phosphohydrolase (DUF442 family)